jgi:hypothetical protein
VRYSRVLAVTVNVGQKMSVSHQRYRWRSEAKIDAEIILTPPEHLHKVNYSLTSASVEDSTAALRRSVTMRLA